MTIESRYVRRDDERMDTVLVPLHPAWWSRPYEYAWARQFAHAEDTVLDAASGIPHPFKFWLVDRVHKVYACDLDPRILSNEAIRSAVADDFGIHISRILPERYIENVERAQADLAALPYPNEQFDTVFCISVLEHLDHPTRLKSLKEFARVLRPDGRLVLTVDVPEIEPEQLAALLSEAGLMIVGPLSTERPDDAIFTTMYGPVIYCFRALIKKRHKDDA
ncbi:class I SAM-dependent methyltransferase [Paenibacillus sp. PDC88]|uniref:class I SAM-dependent methyltransferase n=1 Tax=Paenibacillus sp. PDC88 TaxID=1884375 RepID=UPI00089AD517|nr:class I SAM-dependent methyltransferase [Paenibacillus sp. PDC88]SDW89001.1 Methyltransferase domain-containing protein [Paenibacillus sp. PDC88]